MRLATYLKNGSACLGAVVGDWMVDLRQAHILMNEPGSETPTALNDMLSLLQRMETNFPLVAEIIRTVEQIVPSELIMLVQKEALTPIEESRYLAPVLRPGKLICIGLNYPAPNQGNTDQAPTYPVLFHKVVTSLVGHQGAVLYPRSASQLAYEGELALVIGRRAKYVDIENCLSVIAGYTIANDIGSPDLERRTSQWTTGKMLDTFCPLGPQLVTREEVPDPNKLRILTTLNGDTVQAGDTSEMFFNIPYLVSYLSSLVTLEPGDVILTGSPKRNGDQPDPRSLMQPGDVVCVEIERIGKLCNPILAEE